MKKLVLLFSVLLVVFLTSCSTPQPGSYAWSKKYSGSGMAANRSSQCGVKKYKTPKDMKVKYTNAKKSKKRSR